MQEAHSREWWRATVVSWQASGQTATGFAGGLSVNPKSLSWWQGEFRREAQAARRPAARFVEVQVPRAAPTATLTPAPTPVPASIAAPPQRLVVQVGPVRFDVQVGTDPGYLAALFAAVGKAGHPC